MAIDYRLPPSIESFSPQGDHVPLDAVIEARISTDLDRSKLAGSVSVIDPQGQPVPGVLSYENRVLRFTPNLPLRSNSAYTVILHGLASAGTNGVIQSVVGVPIGVNVTVTFHTVATAMVVAPALISPADVVEVAEVALSWQTVEGAAAYHVQAFTDPTLQALAWETKTTSTSANPLNLPEGQYWWRVAASDQSGGTGPWSAPFTFLYAAEAPAALLPVEPPIPVFVLHKKTVTTSPTVLEIKWPYPVELKSIKLYRENLAGDEVAVTFTDEWTENVLRITPTEET